MGGHPVRKEGGGGAGGTERGRVSHRAPKNF